jgi:uncharacterized repeat protein (TIGR02543 family)
MKLILFLLSFILRGGNLMRHFLARSIALLCLLACVMNLFPANVSALADQLQPDQAPLSSEARTTGRRLSPAARLAEKQQSMASLAGLAKTKPGRDYLADEVTIQATDLLEARQIAAGYEARVKKFSSHGFAVLKLKKGQSVLSAVKLGASTTNSLVAVHPNYLYKTLENEVAYTANDPALGSQYFHTGIHDYLAWDITRGSASTVVAVIDTGIDTDHPEFTNRISPQSYNVNRSTKGIAAVNDDLGHGTHVAGIIAATQDNLTGGSGVAPGVSLLVIKANLPAPDTDKFALSDMIDAIYYAADNGAEIINMSLGRRYAADPNNPEVPDSDPLELAAIQYARNKGLLIVCAAGNDGASHAGFPAAYPEVIAVSAVSPVSTIEDGYTIAGYSNVGPEIDLAAPGTNIYSTYPDDSYQTLSGTSMACPMVAGVAALVKSQAPALTNEEIRQKLYQTAFDLGATGRDNQYGNGLVDSMAALHSRITFDSQGGSAVDPVTLVNMGLVPEPAAPTREHYTFAGWYTGLAYQQAWDFAADQVRGDRILYARWRIEQKQVSFVDPRFGLSFQPVMADYGSLLSGSPQPIMANYHFEGWYRSLSDPLDPLARWDLTAEPVTSNLTLYAGWTPAVLHQVTIQAGNPDYGQVSSGGAFYDDQVDLATVAALPNDTYRFRRWVRSGTDETVSTAAVYTFAVIADTDLVAEFVKIETPIVSAASAGYNAITVQWPAIEGAAAYEIYQSTALSGPYTLIGTPGGTRFTQTGLTTNQIYYYQVRVKCLAGLHVTFGSYSSIKSARPIPARTARIMAASTSYTSIKVSWAAVAGATGYLLWRATSAVGSYTLIQSTPATYFSNTRLTTGKSYYYKVRAYRIVNTVRVYGPLSAIASARPVPATVKSVTAARIPYGVNLKWAAVSGATKYAIYYARAAAGPYAKAGETASTSYTKSGLAVGPAYYFKIRAYRLVGTVRVYGSFSAVVKGTARKPYDPAWRLSTSGSTLYNVTKLTMTFYNDGVAKVRILNAGSYLRYDGDSIYGNTAYDRYLQLINSVGTNITCLDIPAGTSAKIYFKVKGYPSRYRSTSRVFFEFKYDFIHYYAYGSHDDGKDHSTLPYIS